MFLELDVAPKRIRLFITVLMPIQIAFRKAKWNLHGRKGADIAPPVAENAMREDRAYVVLINAAYALQNLLNNHAGFVRSSCGIMSCG